MQQHHQRIGLAAARRMAPVQGAWSAWTAQARRDYEASLVPGTMPGAPSSSCSSMAGFAMFAAGLFMLLMAAAGRLVDLPELTDMQLYAGTAARVYGMEHLLG